MDMKKILVTGMSVLVLVGSGVGAAIASSNSAKAPNSARTERTSTVDTDNIQQGDQSAPDTVAKSASTKAPKTASTKAATTADPDNIQQGDQSAPDTSTTTDAAKAATANQAGAGESSSESGGESTSESDGPGGHQDPSGDVNHEFNGQE